MITQSHFWRRLPAIHVLLLAFFCIGAPGLFTAHAKDIPVRLTDTLTLEYRTDNENGESDDDNYYAVVNRLNLSANSKSLSTSVRVDSMAFHDSPAIWHRNDARIERLNVTYRLGKYKLQVGDFYQQLGRGIVLALRKVDEVGVDIGVRGGQIKYETRRHNIGVFAGRVNLINMDNFKQRFIEDTDDILAGGNYQYRGLKFVKPGMHYLYRRNRTKVALAESQDASSNVGMSMELPDLWESGSLYVEGNYQQLRIGDKVREGKAAYGTIDLFFGDTSILVEGLYLDGFLQESSVNQYGEVARYNQPPTLERIDQQTSLGEDEWGARVRIEHAVMEGDLVFYANGMTKRVFPGKRNEVEQYHAYAGMELQFQNGRSRFQTNGGFRDENTIGTGRRQDIVQMTHAGFDYLQYITKGYALNLSGLVEHRTLRDGENIRGSQFIGIEKSSLGSITFEYGVDTTDASPGIRTEYYAGLLNYKAADWLQLRMTVGTQRGGLKCVGGICRIYPSFAGYRLEILGNHDLGG